jgi:phosphatidylglycerol---prolipoprotein diacylglyceryl transferase
MRPILFRWRGLTIPSYPAMLYLGLVAGVAAGNLAAHAAGLDALRVYIATCLLIVPALMGARLLHVALHGSLYRANLRRIWNRNDGGAAQYGGLIAVPLSVPMLAALRLPFGAFWDVATLTILVGMIFGRVGCLLQGCCAGRPSEAWCSVYLPNHAGVWEKRFPTQCFEALWAAALLAAVLSVWHWLPFPGAVFLLVTAGYASGRVVMEFFREQQPGAGSFSVYHGFSVALFLLSLATLTARWPK